MRNSFSILLFLILLVRASPASEQTTAECRAPDAKHFVFLNQPDESIEEYQLEIRSMDIDQPLFTRAGGYAKFKAATSPENFKCLWSPDSKFVAIFERETKRTGETTMYSVHGDKIQDVALPDLMPLLRSHLTAEIRALWVRPEVWLPDRQLILSVEGTQMDEAKANFCFIHTLQLHTDKMGHVTATTVSFRQDRSVRFSIE